MTEPIVSNILGIIGLTILLPAAFCLFARGFR